MVSNKSAAAEGCASSPQATRWVPQGHKIVCKWNRNLWNLHVESTVREKPEDSETAATKQSALFVLRLPVLFTAPLITTRRAPDNINPDTTKSNQEAQKGNQAIQSGHAGDRNRDLPHAKRMLYH